MEIPVALRSDVIFAIQETACFGPIGTFSSAADIASIGGFWGYLFVKYAQYYGYSLDDDNAKKICMSVLTAVGGYFIGGKQLLKILHLIPGAGTLSAMGINTLGNAVFTYRFAVTLTRVFESGDVDFSTIVESIKTMFAGTGNMLINLKDIVVLMKDELALRKKYT